MCCVECFCIYTNFDFFCENGFLRAISHRRQSLELGVVMRRIWSDDISDVIIVLLYKTVILCSYHDSYLIIDITLCKTVILCSYHDSCLIIDITLCKDQRENVQIMDETKTMKEFIHSK